jgi:hypothetical protein
MPARQDEGEQRNRRNRRNGRNEEEKEEKKKQIGINHTQEGIGHGRQPARQVEGQQ